MMSYCCSYKARLTALERQNTETPKALPNQLICMCGKRKKKQTTSFPISPPPPKQNKQLAKQKRSIHATCSFCFPDSNFPCKAKKSFYILPQINFPEL